MDNWIQSTITIKGVEYSWLQPGDKVILAGDNCENVVEYVLTDYLNVQPWYEQWGGDEADTSGWYDITKHGTCRVDPPKEIGVPVAQAVVFVGDDGKFTTYHDRPDLQKIGE